jgi:hypothetical protein
MNETEITGTRKTVIIILAGVVAAVALIGCFVPAARDYAAGIVKAVLGAVETLGR